jgi:hypothetical protein
MGEEYMIIYIKQSECENIIKNQNDSILSNVKYKKILNDFYNPDKYLFFVDKGDVIPLVVKDNLVTFYGGIHYNEYNVITKNKDLLNKSLDYLKNSNLDFRLLSIINDCYDSLEEQNIILDVPYSATWIFKDICNFDKQILLSSFSSKKRYNINRILKRKNNYIFKTLEYNEFRQDIRKYLDLHISYFEHRGLESGWCGKEKLFIDIMDYLNGKEKLFIQLVKRDNDCVGIYILAYNNEEMIYIFGGTFDKDDDNISMLIYFDIFEKAKEIANKYDINDLDAMRGSFGYKKKLNFKPKALYALVHDKNWIPALDQNLTNEEYRGVYKRNFGVFKEVKI